jgi:hypothetical protein
MARTITKETKKEGQGKAKRRTTQKNKKKRRELVPLMVGSYLTHNGFNVVNMQIMGSNSNGGSKISITRQCNLPFYNRG